MGEKIQGPEIFVPEANPGLSLWGKHCIVISGYSWPFISGTPEPHLCGWKGLTSWPSLGAPTLGRNFQVASQKEQARLLGLSGCRSQQGCLMAVSAV